MSDSMHPKLRETLLGWYDEDAEIAEVVAIEAWNAAIDAAQECLRGSPEYIGYGVKDKEDYANELEALKVKQE